MSKVDDLRALREARYAAQSGAGTPAGPAPGKAAAAPARTGSRQAAPATRGRAAAPAAAAATEAAPCGHRNMSGRGCTRPSGHTEKNHRYG